MLDYKGVKRYPMHEEFMCVTEAGMWECGLRRDAFIPAHPPLLFLFLPHREDNATGQGYICQYVFEIDFESRTWRKLLRRKKQNRRPGD